MKEIKRKKQSGFTIFELVIVCILIGIVVSVVIPALSKVQGCSTSSAEVHMIDVRELRTMYSTDNDNRFYRVFTEDNAVYDIRDEWMSDRSGELFASLRRGQRCKVVAMKTWHCWKYPCIKEVHGCKVLKAVQAVKTKPTSKRAPKKQ